MSLARPSRRRRPTGGFTLPEVVFSMLVLTLVSLSCMAAVNLSRVSSAKAREQAIALDFALHYLETIRGLNYDDVRSGMPINGLFDGTGGAPDIRIPASGATVGLDTLNYQTFHPELTWLAARSPQMRVTLTERNAGGGSHDKHLHVEVRWQAPLGRGGWLSVALDAYRVRDL